jgi:uncharacterized membrane protein
MRGVRNNIQLVKSVYREGNVNSRWTGALSGFLIAVMFAIALWAIDELPAGARIAVHWGPDGEPNGWMGKWPGLLFIPVLATVVWFMASASREGNSFPGKLDLPAHARRAVFVCVLLIQAIAQTAIAINALGRKVDPGNYISIAMGALFILMGVGFKSLQWNFFGIGKTLFNEAVWDKTQMAGRWIFIFCGLGIIAVTFALPQGEKALGVSILTLGAPLLTVFYAYLVSRRLGR